MDNMLNSSEALYGFVAWLTNRKTHLVLSENDDATSIADLIDKFCTANNLPEVSDDWPNNLIKPIERTFNKPERFVYVVFLHCTAYPHQDLVGKELVEAVRSWHLDRGFSDIGYHYLIDKNGTLLEGRNLEKTPAAQKGYNSNSIAICLDGLFEDQFNVLQFDTLRKISYEINEVYNYDMLFRGHCEVSNKTCPVFDYGKVLSLDKIGHITGIKTEDIIRTLSLTSKGNDVIALQRFLGIDADGMFGQDTYLAVRKFQKNNNLKPDGIVGLHTWDVIRYLGEVV
jgi:N-acetylmuramoyl-L-alanine amidase